MPRLARHAPGGVVYHVMNRANGRLRLFKKEADFVAFERVLLQAHDRVPIRILDWCLMGSHWHLVLWPRREGELTWFMRWLTLTHAQRWKHAHDAVGWGHLYQGRFKSVPVQDDHHLLTMLRYVSRNPVAAKLTMRAEQWRWGSLWVRQQAKHEMRALLHDGPVERPRNWVTLVNTPLPPAEREMVEQSLERGRPLGEPAWVRQTAARLNLGHTLHPRGRPVGWRKKPKGDRKRAEESVKGSRHL